MPKTGKVVKIFARNMFHLTISFSFSSCDGGKQSDIKIVHVLALQIHDGVPFEVMNSAVLKVIAIKVSKNCTGLFSYGFISEIPDGL